ncbi:MAG: hypothetical protein ABGZ17_02265 [Planctomycetaceae bacterium]
MISEPAKKDTTCPPTLNRQTFRTSRQMDFFSEKELVTQTGHAREEWPLVFLKETIDNALDACDEQAIAPVLHVEVSDNRISVTDNAGGIPESTIEGVVDFTVRTSSREMYVAPDRGAQGNALMTLLGMPRVIDPDDGCLKITANGKEHRFQCTADPVTQEPVIVHDVADVPDSDGTTIAIEWAAEWPFGEHFDDSGTWCDDETQDAVIQLIKGFGLFNPHATIMANVFATEWTMQATDPAWKKWKPSDPTCPHWYELHHLRRLIGAYISQERQTGKTRTVGEFIREFKGLTGTQKAKRVLADCDLLRTQLADLATDDGLDDERINALLGAMKTHAKPVKPKGLGVIGEDHLRQSLESLGCIGESITYKKTIGHEADIPYVLECAFGYLGDDVRQYRQIYAGANWSAAIRQPFRSFGSCGDGLESLLSKQYATGQEPVVFVLHLAHPRVDYTDRGKSAIALGSSHRSE